MTYLLTQDKQLSNSSISARSSGILTDFNGSRISFIINFQGTVTNKTHFTLRRDAGGTSYSFKSIYKEFSFEVASLGNIFVSHCLQHTRNWVIIYNVIALKIWNNSPNFRMDGSYSKVSVGYLDIEISIKKKSIKPNFSTWINISDSKFCSRIKNKKCARLLSHNVSIN